MSRITVVLKTNEGGMWAVPQIRAMQGRGHSVTVVLPGGDGRLRRALDARGIPVAESPFGFVFRPGVGVALGLWRLRQTIGRTQPDILFYHLYASALAARIASIGMGLRRVHMVAGPLYLESPAIRAVERVLCRMDNALVAGSEYTAAAYRSLGMPGNRVHAIPYGVDTEHFRRGDDRRAQLFGCSPETFVVIMVAYVYAPKSSVHPGVGIKGHDVLLDAWQQFRREHPDSLLVLVGSGFDAPGEAHRQRLIDTYAVDADPTVRWFSSTEDVRPFYSSADLSVSPSLSENHGAALEASAMGLPLLVSDAGALPETVTTDSGFVVRRGSADALGLGLRLAHAAFAGGTLARMGEASRRHCEAHFAHSAVLPRLVQSLAPATPRRVLALTEQRGWMRDGRVLVRKPLPIVELMAARTTVSLALRVGLQESGGVVPAPSSTAITLDWPSAAAPLQGASRLISMARTLLPETRRAAVVYADQPGLIGGLGLLAGRLFGKPLVVNVVGDSRESVHPSVIHGLRGRLAHVVLPSLQTWSCQHATYINYVTSSVLQARYPAPRARASFASSTVSALGPARPRTFPSARVAVVTVGSLEQTYKGTADLLDAIGYCREQGADMTLTVIGEGRLRGHYEALAGRLGDEVVTFTGQLYGEELYATLGRHDVFALASWTEGLPRALIEAMADGMPAIATGVGGVPELLEASRIAPVRHPGAFADALMRLLADRRGWDESISHNERISSQLLHRKGAILADFVDRIVNVSEHGANQ